MNCPILIPFFNQPTYLRNMLSQLESLGLRESVIVVDNLSTYPPAVALLDELEATGIEVLRWCENRGPRMIFRDEALMARMPQYYCITDPDLELNPDLPRNFVEVLAQATESYMVGKAGFALDISDRNRMKTGLYDHGPGVRCPIWEWEERFWTPDKCVGMTADGAPVYSTIVDTTFACYNKRFFRIGNCISGVRVGGHYTARHLPWYRESIVPAEEETFYAQAAKWSEYAAR